MILSMTKIRSIINLYKTLIYLLITAYECSKRFDELVVRVSALCNPLYRWLYTGLYNKHITKALQEKA